MIYEVARTRSDCDLSLTMCSSPFYGGRWVGPPRALIGSVGGVVGVVGVAVASSLSSLLSRSAI